MDWKLKTEFVLEPNFATMIIIIKIIIVIIIAIIIIIIIIINSYFSSYCQNFTETTKLKPNQTLFDRT